MPDRQLIRSGFVLLLLAMLTGLLIPVVANPRMALAAHVTGAMAGLTLVVVGLAWPHVVRSRPIGKTMRACLLFAAFGNWVAGMLASVFGTNKLTPLNGGPGAAVAWQETAVAALQVAQAIAILVALSLAVYELRPGRGADQPRSGRSAA